MPVIDYDTLINAYLFHAWKRLSDKKAAHTNIMPGTDYQTLWNPY